MEANQIMWVQTFEGDLYKVKAVWIDRQSPLEVTATICNPSEGIDIIAFRGTEEQCADVLGLIASALERGRNFISLKGYPMSAPPQFVDAPNVGWAKTSPLLRGGE